MDKILLANGRLHTLSEILSLYNLEDLYTVFEKDGYLFLDKITASNVLEIKPYEYNYKIFNGKECLSLLNPKTEEWIAYENLTDTYNARTGKYQKLFSNAEHSTKDVPIQVFHLDGNKLNNQPYNISRIEKDLSTEIGLDYYKSICHSREPELIQYATELYPFISMKKEYKKYILQDFYDSHSHSYLSMPVSWNFLTSVFGSCDAVNKFADGVLRENTLHRQPTIPNNALKVYLASEVISNEGKRLTSFMESFLESRGYKVYSSGRHLAEMDSFSLTKDKIAECDLMVACCNDRMGCFTGETRIRLVLGETMAIKDMKRRRAGYKILTYDTKKKKFVEGFTYGSVCTKRQEPVFVVELTTSEIIKCTADHPFLATDNTYVEAQNLKPGTQLKSIFADTICKVKQVYLSAETIDMYGLEVMTDNHNYVLATGGLVVKNSSLEIGIKTGLWLEQKHNAEQICNTNIDSLSESDLAVINQTVPRIITFSDKAVQADLLIKENFCLKHCSSWRELADVLDSIDRTGILYAKP